MNFRRFTYLGMLFLPLILTAQGESNHWYFGFGGGLRFDNDGTVEVLSEGQTRASEGVSTISDSEGRLLFYTDGNTVFNRNHLVMENGDGLLGTEASTQSSVIVPLPQNPNLYYIFTVDATSTEAVPRRGRGLNYTVVDISLDGGNGAVIEKNIGLLGDCTEKVAAVIGDCENEVIWIVTISTLSGAYNPVIPPYPSFDTYHAFRMNANGVDPNSVASTFPGVRQADQGYLRFSPDGTKIADARMLNGLFIADFNKATGEVLNHRAVPINDTFNIQPYGVEFSPNSELLYVHSWRKRPGVFIWESSLLQYDLTGPGIPATQINIDENDIFRGALQLAPNGKIYRTVTPNFDNDFEEGDSLDEGVSYLGVINDPNERGPACNYEHNAVELTGKRVRQGLPPLVQSFFSEVNLNRPEDTMVGDTLAACLGEPLILEAQQIPGASYAWTKDGNPISAPQENRIEIPVANASDAGNYAVSIIRPNAENCPISGEIEVGLFETPAVEDFEISVCDTGDANANDGIMETDLISLFENAEFDYTFYSTQADFDAGVPIAAPEVYVNNTPFEEILFYRAFNQAGCEGSGEMTLRINSISELVMDDTYQICTDQSDNIIEGPDGYDFYAWFDLDDGENPVSTEKNFNVTMEGTYRLDAGIILNNNGLETRCLSSVEFEVLPSNAAVIDEININRFTDADTDVEIIVTGEGEYEYSWDGTNFQDENLLTDINAGTVTFSVRDKKGCGTVTQTIEVEPDISSGFPGFFTPNSDGSNDNWQVLPAPKGEELDYVNIRIFNRYGQLLVQMDPQSAGWDGTFNGKPLPASDYWFLATRSNGKTVKGHFTLKR